MKVRSGKQVRGVRGRGEGTICKRSDGRWQAAITLPGGKRKHVYGHSQQEAHEKLLALQFAIRQPGTGAVVALLRPKMTVADLLGRWLHDVVQSETRPLTAEGYA